MARYGERLVVRLLTEYPEAEQWLPRAGFYAQTFELFWALSGVTSGDKGWFMAHLAMSRDIHLQ
jgi:hypothetical protein